MLHKLMGELSVKRMTPQPVSLTPSSIHFLLLDQFDYDTDTIPPLTEDLPCLHHLPRLQVVYKDNAWFALNSAQLHLFRTLEQAGKCSKIPVDVVSVQRVPPKLRHLMVVKQPADTSRVDTKKDFKQLTTRSETDKSSLSTVVDTSFKLEDKHGILEKQDHTDSTADTEVAAAVHTVRGYHPLVQRDPNDDVTSEQSGQSDTEEGSSEESESDCESVQSESASELGFSGWSDEDEDDDDDVCDVDTGDDEEDSSSDSSRSGSTVSREKLNENDCLL